MVVDEWGPYDWKTPKLWPLDSLRAVPLRLRVMGPAGSWRLVTRTGLAVHARIIEIAHLVGARDNYVARQIQRHALWLGLVGGAFGLLLAAATWWALGHVVGLVAVPFLPPLQPDWLRWIWIALLVPLAGLLAMMTARRTVFATLRRML